MFRRWSAEEDALLSYARVVEIAKVLPSRTYEAIKRRRRFLGFASPLFPRWKKSEDKLIIKYAHEPLAKLTKRIKNRTYDAIKARRSELGYISEKSAELGSDPKFSSLSSCTRRLVAVNYSLRLNDTRGFRLRKQPAALAFNATFLSLCMVIFAIKSVGEQRKTVSL
jgi:hypothetical protein